MSRPAADRRSKLLIRGARSVITQAHQSKNAVALAGSPARLMDSAMNEPSRSHE
jgi:hypothetical protein